MLGVETHCSAHTVEVTAGAGEEWNALVERSVAMGWAGLECLAGIPGLVGATPIQNVGAYEQEVGETIARMDALDLTTGEIVTLSNADCRFGYRVSRFGQEDQQRFIILAVTFRLTPGGAARIRHIEVQRHVRQFNLLQPTIAEIRDLVVDIRRRKGMIFDTTDPNTRSAGSFFINPMLNATQFAALEALITAHYGEDTHIPRFPTANGAFKIPAAWLIEHSDFSRGYVRGNVGISEKHTLSLINRGAATARELVQLACEIRDRVYDRFGIMLLPEPRFVGISMAV
jgi:UDP-N-acetylmuramate dehydrogenase